MAVIIVMIIISFLFGMGDPRKRGSKTEKPYSEEYHGVYSHGSRSVDTELHFPVLKDSTAPFPMNKREEREKTETFENRENRI